jgi:hypothetical protein
VPEGELCDELVGPGGDQTQSNDRRHIRSIVSEMRPDWTQPATDGGTAPDIPLLVTERIVALVAPALASPPASWEKEERAKKECGTLPKLCSALPEWAGPVRDFGLVPNVKVNQQDVFDGQCVSCTLADGSTRAKVPMSLVRSLHVSKAVPSGLDVSTLGQLRAIKVDGIDMCSVDFLPPRKAPGDPPVPRR